MSERASWERHRYRSPHPNGWHSAVRPSVRLMVRPAAAAMQRSDHAGGRTTLRATYSAGGRTVGSVLRSKTVEHVPGQKFFLTGTQGWRTS